MTRILITLLGLTFLIPNVQADEIYSCLVKNGISITGPNSAIKRLKVQVTPFTVVANSKTMKFFNFELFPSLNDFDREFTAGIDQRYGGRTTIEKLDGGYKLKQSYPGEETIIVIDRLGYININQIWLFGGNVVPSDYVTRRVIAECR